MTRIIPRAVAARDAEIAWRRELSESLWRRIVETNSGAVDIALAMEDATGIHFQPALKAVMAMVHHPSDGDVTLRHLFLVLDILGLEIEPPRVRARDGGE